VKTKTKQAAGDGCGKFGSCQEYALLGRAFRPQPAMRAKDLKLGRARINTGHHGEWVIDTHLIPLASVADGCTINEQKFLPRRKMTNFLSNHLTVTNLQASF
jgi:hypothetical protein